MKHEHRWRYLKVVKNISKFINCIKRDCVDDDCSASEFVRTLKESECKGRVGTFLLRDYN